MLNPKNSLRNSYLIKTCKTISLNVLQDKLKEVFFRHLEAPSAEKGIKIVEDFTDAETNVRVGYGDVGLENLVSALKSQRLSSVKMSRIFMSFRS